MVVGIHRSFPLGNPPACRAYIRAFYRTDTLSSVDYAGTARKPDPQCIPVAGPASVPGSSAPVKAACMEEGCGGDRDGGAHSRSAAWARVGCASAPDSTAFPSQLTRPPPQLKLEFPWQRLHHDVQVQTPGYLEEIRSLVVPSARQDPQL